MSNARTIPAVKGIPFIMGGVTYTLPPASLATLEAMAEPLDAVNKAFESGVNLSLRELIFVADFTTACLQRNHPEVTRELVAQHVGLENVFEVVQMCLDVSGFLRKQHEAQAAQATAAQEGGTLGESAGTASSPTS